LKISYFVSIFLFALSFPLLSQKTNVSGKIIDATSGSPIPFANVIFTGTEIGTTTDFDGNFNISTKNRVDSLTVSYIGYVSRTKSLIEGEEQAINFQLEEDIINLSGVTVYAGENPAFQILRNVVDHKSDNDKRSLEAYEYETYTKIEIDIDNISENLREKKIMKRVQSVLDSIDQVAGEDGKPVLPIFISEAISKFYYKKSPRLRHENVLKTKVTGIGIEDGTLVSQIIGSTFQEYNFYQNWLNIVGKEFVSPISDGWRLYYDYDLIDSLYIGDHFCYRLDFWPRRPQDLAFRGTLWITKSEFALRRIDGTITKEANLNFVEKIKIQQDLMPTSEGPWLPVKSRVVVDISELTKKSAGFIAKFYVSAEDISVNQPKDNRFYENPVVLESDVRSYNDAYWDKHRHDTLSSTEISVYKMIDTLRKIPPVKRVTDILTVLGSGYYDAGKFDLGPYTVLFGNNDIEGIRLGFGMRTDIDLSDKLVLEGYGAYGFNDDSLKYKAGAKYIISRKPWTTISYFHQKEVDQIWLLNDDIPTNSFFYSFSRFGTLTQPFLVSKNVFEFEGQVSNGLIQRVKFRTQDYNPLFDFNFFKSTDADAQTGSKFSISEVTIQTRYARDELWVINDNERISLGTVRFPAVTFTYTRGFDNLFNSDFSYHKLGLRMFKFQKMGLLGRAAIDLEGGYIFGELPYPLLHNPIGNESPFYINFTFNQMNYFEFSSDRFVSLRYRHFFEGLLLNKVPLFRKLKWRLTGTANLILGGIRDENVEIVARDENGLLPFTEFEGGKPYVEVGYGIENIFKIFRVDAFHRLTYLDSPDARDFGVKFSVQLIL